MRLGLAARSSTPSMIEATPIARANPEITQAIPITPSAGRNMSMKAKRTDKPPLTTPQGSPEISFPGWIAVTTPKNPVVIAQIETKNTSAAAPRRWVSENHDADPHAD